MEKYLMTILLCAGVAVSMLASEPLGACSQQLDGAQVSNSNVMAAGEQVSMSRFMRERGLTPDNNRMAGKAPRRLSIDDMTGDRIAMVDFSGYQDSILTSGNVNWMASLMAGDSDNRVRIKNFCTIDINAAADSMSLPEDIIFDSNGLIPIGLPVELDVQAGTALLCGDVPVYHDSVMVVDPANDKVKITKVTDVFLVPFNAEVISGNVYDDGSIMFDGDFMLSTRLAYRGKIGSYISYDTVYVESPVYSNFCLMVPNGQHQYKKARALRPGGGSGGTGGLHIFDASWGLTNPPDVGMGVGGRKPIKPGSDGDYDIKWTGTGDGGGVGDGVCFVSSDNSNGNTPNGVGTDGFGRDCTIHESASDNDVADINGVGGRKPAKPGKPGKATGDCNENTLLGVAGSSTGADIGDNDSGMSMSMRIIHPFESVNLYYGHGPFEDYNGVGGRRPVKPGNSNFAIVGSSDAKNHQVENSPYANYHVGEYGGEGGNGGNGGNGSSGDCLMLTNTGNDTVQYEAPVYVFQADDDGLVYICNLYGSMLINYMCVNSDGTMTFPCQLISRDGYNFGSVSSPGCAGTAEPGMITWGDTQVSRSSSKSLFASYRYTDNCLTFTEGMTYEHAPVANITAVTSKINDVLNGNGSITEVTTLINEMLYAR